MRKSWNQQRTEAAGILASLDTFSVSNSRIDDVARTLRNQGRAAAERRAAEIYRDPYFAI